MKHLEDAELVWNKGLPTQVTNFIFLGDSQSFDNHGQKFRYVVQAAKEPYHRQALGYTSAGAPKDSPEYYGAIRKVGDQKRLILNLVDAKIAEYIPRICFDLAHQMIQEAEEDRSPVLVHCNKGESRSPAIVFTYLISKGVIASDSLHAVTDFKNNYYPSFNPGAGIKDFLHLNFRHYRGKV